MVSKQKSKNTEAEIKKEIEDKIQESLKLIYQALEILKQVKENQAMIDKLKPPPTKAYSNVEYILKCAKRYHNTKEKIKKSSYDKIQKKTLLDKAKKIFQLCLSNQERGHFESMMTL